MRPVFLSVDLGGTSLRMALLDEEGHILARQDISSDSVRETADLIRVLSQEAELFRFRAEKIDAEIRGMALGIPGLVDVRQGVVLQSPHFPAWKNVALREALGAQLPFPVQMDNDANQAALGEAWKGAGKNWPDFILLTLGTGIGGGIIHQGKIFHGPNGFAGEVGHIVIERNGLPGALGSRGTLETLASQSGLRLQLQARGNALNLSLDLDDPTFPERLFQFARDGNTVAQEIWTKFGEALACGIVSLANAFGFNRFVIGGGLAAARELFAPSCREEISRRTYPAIAGQIEVVPAKLGNDAGLIGGLKSLLE